ncbi:MAG TPA: hypothetical protein VFI65_27220 [Streptosporangiaceae bacterium]|nr:hypothetical protein [Streptosporangiaceae bacterium]
MAFAAGGDAWTGNGDGSSWTVAANWSAGVPQNGESVAIGPVKNTPTPHVVGMPSGLSLKDLTLTNSSLDGGAATITGNFTWSVAQSDTGSLDAPLTVKGSATIKGAGRKDTFAPLTFAGATEVSGGLVLTEDTGPAITNTGTFTLKPGAEIEALACCVSLYQFINSGSLRMAAPGSATLAAMDLHDNGTISVGKGSTLQVTGGPVELSKSVGVTGSGTVDFDLGASVALASQTSIASGATLQLNGNARFTGTGSFTGSGHFAWTGGAIEGNLDVAKTVSTAISGKGLKNLTSVTRKPVLLSLHGKTTFKGPGLISVGIAKIVNSGTLTEFPGALVQGLACCVSPSQIVNTGTLVVPGAKKGIAGIGLLDLKDQGSISVGKGSTLHVTVGPVEFKAGVGVSGGGTLEFDASSAVTLAKKVSIGSGTTVQLTGESTLNGTGSFIGSGHLLWTGGSIQANLDVGKSITTTISGPLTKFLQTLTSKPVLVTLHGKTTMTGSGPLEMGSAATLANLGAMTLHSGTAILGLACCVAPDHFANGGTLVIAASPGNTGITNMTFANTGEVKLVNGTFTVSGTGYHQAKSGVLAMTATGTMAGKNYGQLIVEGPAALAGTIRVTSGGSFKPKAGQTLAVLQYETRTGKFTASTGSVKFKVIYKASGATIRFS